MNAEQRQTAADPWTKPTDLSHWPAFRQLRNYIHHRRHYYSAGKLMYGFVNVNRKMFNVAKIA